MAFKVFASPGAREVGSFSSYPLLAFRPPPEFCPSRSRPSERRSSLLKGCLPCGFFPFDVFPMVGSHVPPRSTSPGLSCLLSVSHALEALLRPPSAGLVSCRSRPWGSPFRADFRSQSSTSSRKPVPSCGWSEDLRFRVLLPVSVHVSRRASSSRNSDPHGLHLPRGLFLFAGFENHPLMSFMVGKPKLADHCSSEYWPAKRLASTLASLPPLSRFATSSTAQLFTRKQLWIAPRGP